MSWCHPPKYSTMLDLVMGMNVAASQLLNQLGSEILLQFPFVLGRRKAGFDCPDTWHSPIPVWQLPDSLRAKNLLHKRLVDKVVKTLPKYLLYIGEFPPQLSLAISYLCLLVPPRVRVSPLTRVPGARFTNC
jgi:hypothetical protein